MASVNKAILIGHLGRDPEVRYTAGGDAVCNFSIATSEQWKDKNGEKQERTEWHRITTWGKLAEIAGEHLKKGALVYIEGSIRTNKYTDKDGAEKYSTDIHAQQMRFLSRAPDGKPSSQQRERGESPKGGGKRQDDFDDDIPF